MELIEKLVSELGIEQKQAEGGAGLLLKLAKDKLGGDDFSKVSECIPGAEGIIGKAPSGGLMGALGGLASNLGGGDLANLAGLAGGFKSLGLDGDMMGKLVSVVLQFVQGKGGDSVKNLLAGVLK